MFKVFGVARKKLENSEPTSHINTDKAIIILFNEHLQQEARVGGRNKIKIKFGK